MRIKNKKTWFGVLTLIAVEQGIKVVINNNFLEQSLPLLPPFLYFDPMFNRDYSWLNSMLQLGVSKWLHIFLVVVVSIFIYLLYRHVNNRLDNNKIVHVMFAFVFSGAICSLIDKVYWNGSLDYVLVKGLFTFDLKDVYINIFIGLAIYAWLSGNEIIKSFDN